MKYLYELTLNKKELILNRVAEICGNDDYINSNCRYQDIQHSLVCLFFNIVSDTMKNLDHDSISHASESSFEDITESIIVDTIRAFLLSGCDLKLFIIILKHFRSSINLTISQSIDNKDDLYEYLEHNSKYFDFLELSLYNYWSGMEKEEVFLKRVLDLTTFGVFIYEKQYLTYLNSAAERICGYTKEELITENVFDLMHPDILRVTQKDLEAGEYKKEIANGKYECKFISKNNCEVWVEVAISIVELGGRSCLLGTAIDITESKKIEELKLQASESMKLLNEVIEYDKVKTEFFSNLSHELRTPLNVILGSLQLVDMYSSQTDNLIMEKTKKYYKIMRQNCYRLLRLVNNLIDISKLDAGYMQMNMDNYDIVNIISKIAASVSDYIENNGLSFNYSSRTFSKVVACDPDKIERILLNLLSNAVKFTDSGGEIQLTLWDDNSSFFISVKDNGIGIPKEKQDLIFKRFIQIDKSLSRSYQGSGIGLSLVKSLVELHGGKISLISDTGLGCEFIIELPITEITIFESVSKESQYSSNNRIEIISIEFSDIYS